MRLLIFAGGFLGTHVRCQATAAGREVITAGRSAAAGLPRHQLLDLAEDDPARIAAVLARLAPDAVVNCAGATAGDPGMLASANVSGTCALVHGDAPGADARTAGHLGSVAEYGRTEPDVPVSERTHPPGGALRGDQPGRNLAGRAGHHRRARRRGAARLQPGRPGRAADQPAGLAGSRAAPGTRARHRCPPRIAGRSAGFRSRPRRGRRGAGRDRRACLAPPRYSTSAAGGGSRMGPVKDCWRSAVIPARFTKPHRTCPARRAGLAEADISRAREVLAGRRPANCAHR